MHKLGINGERESGCGNWLTTQKKKENSLHRQLRSVARELIPFAALFAGEG